MSLDLDYYAVLELAPGSPSAEVKSQYRRLAKKYHPDLHGNDAKSQDQFRRVNAAYAFLSDVARKAEYDAYLRALSASVPKPPPAPRRVQSRAPSPRKAAGYPPPPIARPQFRSLSDIRMTRSAWLGATAALILALLGIGLFFDTTEHGPAVPASGAAYGALNSAPDARGTDARGTSLGPDGLTAPEPVPQPAPALASSPFHSPAGPAAPSLSPKKRVAAAAPVKVPERVIPRDAPVPKRRLDVLPKAAPARKREVARKLVRRRTPARLALKEAASKTEEDAAPPPSTAQLAPLPEPIRDAPPVSPPIRKSAGAASGPAAKTESAGAAAQDFIQWRK